MRNDGKFMTLCRPAYRTVVYNFFKNYNFIVLNGINILEL